MINFFIASNLLVKKWGGDGKVGFAYSSIRFSTINSVLRMKIFDYRGWYFSMKNLYELHSALKKGCGNDLLKLTQKTFQRGGKLTRKHRQEENHSVLSG
jgi:hypothetical protein